MASLVQTGKYSAINALDTTTLGYYGIKYVSDTFKLQEYIKMNGQVSKAVKLLVRSELISMTKGKKWYWQ